jgi:hypothetical protein
MKLTNPQFELLSEIRNERRHVSDSYAPAKKLVALGLAEFVYGKYGSILQITQAGYEALVAAAPA